MAVQGTATTPYEMIEPPSTVSGDLANPVGPVPTYLEPTIGQIWPR